MNILALEPWYGGSHKNFLDGFMAHSRHQCVTITMAARFWKWRMQGGAATMAQKAAELLKNGFMPDLILATDMVNLPAFLSLTRARLSNVPVVLYLHENQLTYPVPPGTDRDLTYAYINYLSCLAADRVLFNSHFHANSFLDSLPGLLRVFPDYTHLHSVRAIREKSEVMHLGIDLAAHDAFRRDDRREWRPGMEPPIILWNHRWEYDKDPNAFFRVMNRLDDAGSKFRLILAGEHFEQQPSEFERAFERYAERIIHYGYAEDFSEYSRLLHRADIVVSTALHEFFGVAIMEAIYCGCHPLLPTRLSYPELIPESLHRPLLHAPCLYTDEDDLFGILQKMLSGAERPLPELTLKAIPAHLDWRTHAPQFDAMLEDVTAQSVQR
ncbi:MAG: tRNA-queuosine alpha-mannosyltransferase domain-containing protein [Bacteroidota bacterium]